MWTDTVNLKIARRQKEGIIELVRQKKYRNVSQVVRVAIRDLLNREYYQTDLTAFPTDDKERRKDLIRFLKQDPEIREIIEDIVKEISGQ